jgi:hypothetical protein
MTMTIEAQVQAREDLILNNIPLIEANVRRARQRTDEELAALVLDPRDEHGRAIVALAGRPAAAEAERRGVEPIVIWAKPRRLVIAALRDHFPELAAASATLDARGGYLAVSVACGGAAAIIVRPGDHPGGRPVVRVIVP